MGEVTVMIMVMMMILMMTDEHKVMRTAMKILSSGKPAAQSILQHMSLVQLRGRDHHDYDDDDDKILMIMMMMMRY